MLSKKLVLLFFTIAFNSTSQGETKNIQDIKGNESNAISGNENTIHNTTTIYYGDNVEQFEKNKTWKEIILTQPWNTPYLPDHFVKRTSLTQQIQSKFQGSDNQKLNQAILVGLHGLGGVGKTYLALDTIYHPAKEYSFRAWFTSNDEDKLKADYIKLGEELYLFTKDIKEEQKISLVINWLNSQKSLLLVFDNAPDMTLLEKYLPHKGDIIITSRNYKIPSAIEADVMSEAEALLLLKNIIADPNCQIECTDLIKKLGYLPLALSQAGAYIDQNKITVSKYLQLYNSSKDALMQNNTMPVLDKHQPVYITWHLSINEIKENDNTGKAISLLKLLAFCHFVDIPKSLLMEYGYGNKDSLTEIEFNKIISLLRQYSLVKVKPDTLALHHLVQDSIRASLKSHEQQTILKKAIDTIKKIYPLENKQVKNYELVKKMLPHMESMSAYLEEDIEAPYRVELLIHIADAWHKLGDYKKVKALLEKTLIAQKKYYITGNHIEISLTLNKLGRVNLNLGDYNKAKDLFEEALSIQRAHYSMKNIEVALTLRRLGRAYLNLGNYTQTKILLEESVAIQKSCDGKVNDIELAFTLRDLAILYLSLEDYDKARILLEETLESQKSCYETNALIDVIFTSRELGKAYVELGEYNKAKVLLEDILTIQEDYFSNRKNINITFTLIELGRTYIGLRDYNKAKVLLENALDFRESYYGLYHPEVAYALLFLAQLEFITNNEKYALSLLERANQILLNYPGLSHEHQYIKLANNFKQMILNHY